MIDPHELVVVLRAAARQAGAVALHLQGKVPVEHKSEGGILESTVVTAVDRATQDVLLLRLHEAFPDAAIDAEEDTETVGLFAEEEPGRDLIVIDPVDGTLAYTRGSDDWAVMGALIRGGAFVASLVHFPVHALTCWAVRGEGAWIARGAEEGRRIESLPRSPSELLIAPLVPCHRASRARELGLNPVRSRVSAVDSTAPALGRARASIAGDRADRRRALGLLVTTEAGAAVRFGDHVWKGEDPELLPDSAAPTIAADTPELAEAILRTLG